MSSSARCSCARTAWSARRTVAVDGDGVVARLHGAAARRRGWPGAGDVRRRPWCSGSATISAARPTRRQRRQPVVSVIVTPMAVARRSGRPASARCPVDDPSRRPGSSSANCPTCHTCPNCPSAAPGADMIGRTAALLVDLPVEIAAYRLAAHRPRGRDLRRARDFLARDLDALETQADGLRRRRSRCRWPGRGRSPPARTAVSGHRVVTDHGAVRDLAGSLAEGLRRAPGRPGPAPAAGAAWSCRWTSRRCPAVLAGEVPTPSGYGTVRSVEPCDGPSRRCAMCSPWRLGRPGRALLCGRRADRAAARGRAPMRSRSTPACSAAPTSTRSARRSRRACRCGWACCRRPIPTITLRRRGSTIKRICGARSASRSSSWPASVVPTPACGLAGATPAYVRRVLAVLRDVGRSLLDESA